jgi:hypothetical protein
VAATNDSMYTALRLIYPASTERNVGALLQRYRDDNNLEEWGAYVAHIHALAVTAGSPQTTFADASNVAWADLATP